MLAWIKSNKMQVLKCASLLLFVLHFTAGQDDDPGILLRAKDIPNVMEANTAVSVCVDVFGTVPNSTSARIITVDGTARANKDYLPVDLSIALSNTERTMCYDVVILDDDIVEVSESFSVELVDVIGRFRVLQTTADITIIPNIEDTITVAVQDSSYTAIESEGSVEVCAVLMAGGVDPEKPDPVEVRFSLSSDTAESDLDFIEVRQEFSFEPGSMVNTIACVSVTLLDDLVIEMDEQLMLELEESEMVTVDKGRERASVLIIDNDGVQIQLDPIETQFLQEANPGDHAESTKLCVTIEADAGLLLDRAVIVTLELGEGGTVLGEDFVVGESTTLELTTLGSSQCFIVSLVNDDVRESNETIVITPVPLDPDDNVVGGHFTIVILDDGDVNCPELCDPLNGRVTTTSREEGSTAVYECDSGYGLNGTESRVCGNDGKWSGEKPQCLLDCGQPPAVVNGEIEFTTTTVGSKAIYSCEAGRHHIGEVVLECLDSGEWSGVPPLCLAVCSNLSSPMNGKVELNSVVEGSRALYTCYDGYTLQEGDKERECGSDSQWSGMEPFCRPVLCSELDGPVNGQVQSNGISANYSCDDNLALVGESERICDTERGEWIGEAPVCSAGKNMMTLTLLIFGLIFHWCFW